MRGSHPGSDEPCTAPDLFDQTRRSLAFFPLYYNHLPKSDRPQGQLKTTIARFTPTSADVVQACAILQYQFGLPNEFLLIVLDLVRYWVKHAEKEKYRLVLGKGARSRDSSAT
jgi:hypothetical protein